MDLSNLPASRRVSPLRVLAVTAALIGGGALAGAAAGIIGVTLWITVTEGLRHAFDPRIWYVAGAVGAPFGALLLPLAGFTALRRVPLGRLLATTIIAAGTGGAIGASLTPSGWLGGAIAGFLLATAWLWHRSRATSADM